MSSESSINDGHLEAAKLMHEFSSIIERRIAKGRVQYAWPGKETSASLGSDEISPFEWRVFERFGGCLPIRIREGVWDHSFNELRAEFVRRSGKRSSVEIRWLRLCFLLRQTFWLTTTFALMIKSLSQSVLQRRHRSLVSRLDTLPLRRIRLASNGAYYGNPKTFFADVTISFFYDIANSFVAFEYHNRSPIAQAIPTFKAEMDKVRRKTPPLIKRAINQRDVYAADPSRENEDILYSSLMELREETRNILTILDRTNENL